jgi:hypothetical protein
MARYITPWIFQTRAEKHEISQGVEYIIRKGVDQ